MAPKIADFNEGWGEMERAFAKVKMILKGSRDTKFSGEEYMNLHTYPQYGIHLLILLSFTLLHCLLMFSWILLFVFP